MATFSFFQNRLGRTDGVSLEVDKWRTILRDRMGHKVRYCSGNPEIKTNYVIDELYAQHPKTWKILQNATVEFADYQSEQELELDIYNHADVIEQKLLDFIEKEKIDVLVPNNLCSGGYQPAAAIAFHRVMRKTGLPSIIHSHDFYFEDSKEVQATCHTVESIYDRYFPTKLPNVRHVVINSIAQMELKKRKGLNAMVVPNVFDFDQPRWEPDGYNQDFRKSFGIGKDDIVFLQATRILDRKCIELAIDVVSEIDHGVLRKELEGVSTAGGGGFKKDARIILLCEGIVETIGISADYWNALQDKAKKLKVDLLYAGDRVKHSRGDAPDGGKGYSLWDSYVYSDFVTYPSIWEGWGNQFIEAVFAKLPVMVFEYPIWKSDIVVNGFQVVSLGDEIAGMNDKGLACVPQNVVKAAASRIVEILVTPKLKEEMVENNYVIGKNKYSYDVLEKLIRQLTADIV